MRPNFDLSGRLALVTGSSRGIGWAIAQGMAGAGARVLLHRRNAEALKARAAELGGNTGTLAFDVTDAAAVHVAFGDIEAEHGRLDILVNNAGIIPRKPLPETTDADWQAVIDLNLSRTSRNQKGRRRPSAVRANLDDPPIHIRPTVPAISGCKAKEPFRFRPLRHTQGGTAAFQSQRFLQKVSRVRR